MRTIWGALFLVLCFSGLAQADVVILKNGDRISGTLIGTQETNITLKSEALGILKISLSQVESFAVAQPVVVVTENRPSVEGQLEFTPAGDWKLTRNGAPQTIPAKDLNLAMPATPYRDALEASGKPWRLWNGSINVGYNIQNGDQHTNTLSTFVNAVRQLPDTLMTSGRGWRTNYSLMMLFSDASQGETSVSSSTLSTSFRQDYLISSRDFAFAFGQMDHIQPQGLYLRRTTGFGVGRDLMKTKRTRLSTLESVNYEHQKFTTGAAEGSVEGRVGETLSLQVMQRVRLDHSLNYYQNMMNAQKFRADAGANLGLEINKHLTLNTGVVDLHLSNPAEGHRRNTFIFTTGVGLKFAH